MDDKLLLVTDLCDNGTKLCWFHLLPVLKWVEANASYFSNDYYPLHNIFASNQKINLGGGKVSKRLPNNCRFVCVWGTGETKGEISIIKRGKLKKSHCISITAEASQCN